MKKKWKIVAVVFSLLFVLQIGTVVSKAGTIPPYIEIKEYEFQIQSVASGYTWPKWEYKKIGITHAQLWVEASSYDVPTNYIVIGADGRQISDNVITTSRTTTFLRYWSSQHVGKVYLRANSGSTVVGYWVRGTWIPNDYGSLGLA